MTELESKLHSDFTDSIKPVKDKRWIRTGSEVAHRDHTFRKMYVDQIVKVTKKVDMGKGPQDRTFVLGVDCHWIDGNGNYGKGRFLTNELVPWKELLKNLPEPIPE